MDELRKRVEAARDSAFYMSDKTAYQRVLNMIDDIVAEQLRASEQPDYSGYGKSHAALPGELPT